MASDSAFNKCHNFVSKHGPVSGLSWRKVKLLLCFIPCEEISVFTIPYIVHTLDTLAVKVEGFKVSETMANKLQALKPPNVHV